METTYNIEQIKATDLFQVLFRRDIAHEDFDSEEDKQEAVEDLIEGIHDARQRVLDGENPEEILEEDFGLEPDYIFDLMP